MNITFQKKVISQYLQSLFTKILHNKSLSIFLDTNDDNSHSFPINQDALLSLQKLLQYSGHF